MSLRRYAGAMVVAFAIATPAMSQDIQPSPVLTLDQDRMYSASLFGKRVQEDLQSQSSELAQENRKIEGALEEEERRLTDERAAMDPEEFQKLAADFDERVTGIRRAQATKSDSIRRQAEAERVRFFEAAFPILLELVEETGAVAILNNSAVIFSVRPIDITDAAIARIDAAIGASPAPVDPGPLPVQRPDQTPTEAAPQPDAGTGDSNN
ncbi:OmpH family outer membrane protein [Litoreibacter janthinus]|uniref:Periplasmic chaperone for outer membrane proteins Skp n=1 Tax=Litoreibacter janthinus TaxID=670154 RepID=A0A1I6H396_9RHOB|nr:OmpH family outer membrane protein [Litoreibacter janthinus]SFR48913.1 periplasmic chaperone for outer membrane proteins Skp [Litoreibacter janthinus]